MKGPDVNGPSRPWRVIYILVAVWGTGCMRARLKLVGK